MTRVRLIGAQGCHLCHEALEVLESVRSRIPFDLEVVLIDGDSGLEGEYREQIPVVLLDGVKHFKFVVPPDELEKRLKSIT